MLLLLALPALATMPDLTLEVGPCGRAIPLHTSAAEGGLSSEQITCLTTVAREDGPGRREASRLLAAHWYGSGAMDAWAEETERAALLDPVRRSAGSLASWFASKGPDGEVEALALLTRLAQGDLDPMGAQRIADARKPLEEGWWSAAIHAEGHHHHELFIDGVSQGTLPLVVDRLTLGPHEFRIVDPDNGDQVFTLDVVRRLDGLDLNEERRRQGR